MKVQDIIWNQSGLKDYEDKQMVKMPLAKIFLCSNDATHQCVCIAYHSMPCHAKRERSIIFVVVRGYWVVDI